MGRYRFRTDDGQRSEQDGVVELAGDQHAREEAIRLLGAILLNEKGQLSEGGQITVMASAEDGRPVLALRVLALSPR